MKEIDNQTAKFCQEPSANYMRMYEDCGDPKAVSGQYALDKMSSLRARLGWIPDFDARGYRLEPHINFKKEVIKNG